MDQQLAGSRSFDIGEAVAAGWRGFWPNILPMALFALIVFAVNGLLQVLQPDAGATGSFLLSVVGFVIAQLVAIGWIKIALDITDGRPISSEAITERFNLIGPYLIAAVLYALMVGVGLLLLIVPGIILGIVFAFYGFHIVDTGSRDAIGALRRSAELTRGARGRLFLLGLVLIGINVLGLLALVVGVLITSGISLLAIAHVYRRLAPAAGSTAGAAPA
jgi:uncharacterized membrane protein